MKRHNLDKNKNAAALKCSVIVEMRAVCLLQVSTGCKTIEPIFKAIAVSSTSSRSAKANSQNRTTLALSGKAKQLLLLFVSPSFYVIYYSCSFSVLLAAFFAFSMIKRSSERRSSSCMVISEADGIAVEPHGVMNSKAG
jgi:hypothetical protein